MIFWEHFLRVLPYRPKQALEAAYWHITRRKVRARNRLRLASADLPFAYAVWIANNERDSELARNATAATREWAWQPRFTVMLYGHAECASDQLERSIRSVEEQIYSGWTLVHEPTLPLDDAVATVSDYLVPLLIGDKLSKSSLYRFAEALQLYRGCAILYGDQDEIDEAGRRARPWFKPRWNQEMFLAQDYLSGAIAIEATLARAAAQTARTMAELVIEASWTERAIVHVPHILVHTKPRTGDQRERLPIIRRKLRSVGANCVSGPFGTIKVEWPLPENRPLVSIIVPTRDKLELLKPCIESVLDRTDYDNYEILIVDNGSVEKRTADYLAGIRKHPKVRVLVYPKSYNFSAINNYAAREARGTFLCLLNNDTEVVNRDWLAELMRHAVREEVGAVGAKLLYEDGSIQHAGVVIGIGEAAGHAHRYLPSDQPGYFLQAHIAQYVSAVTAACLVVQKKKFDAVGGLDEGQLAIAFNDVDFCLKLEKAGWRNVYVPHAVLLHHESKSRGKDVSPGNFDRYQRELAVLQRRWGTKTYDDPLHNPNLDRYSETFVFRL